MPGFFRATLCIATLSFALAVQSSRAAGPSFDCARASLPAEKAICADPQLSAIDALVAKAYKGFEPSFGGDKRQIAKALVADRNACGSDAAPAPRRTRWTRSAQRRAGRRTTPKR